MLFCKEMLFFLTQLGQVFRDLEFEFGGSHKVLRVVSATFFLVWLVCLTESTCETRKNVFYITSKALFVLEIIKFKFSDIQMS